MKNLLLLIFICLANICYGQISLENTYLDGKVNRTVFDKSGEKYYLLDSDNKQLKIYDLNHNIWKIIDLPVPANFAFSGISHLSDAIISTDSLIEIAYTYYTDNAGINEYESRLIDEKGNLLLNVPACYHLYVSEFVGIPNKLIADIIDGGIFFGKVYSLPTIGGSGINELEKAILAFFQAQHLIS